MPNLNFAKLLVKCSLVLGLRCFSSQCRITETSVRIVSYLSFLPFCTTQATVFLSSMSNPIYFSMMEPPEIKGFVALRTATFIWDVIIITIPCQTREAPVS